jgi:hypothetical protein
MGFVIGEVLFFGLAIVIGGPLTITTAILLLTGERGQVKGVAYLIGWVIGLTLLVVGVVFLVRGRDFSHESTPSLVMAWAKLLGGIALLIVAYVTWRRRPPPDAPLELPGWLKRIHQTEPPLALGAGFFFGLFSVKNLLIVTAAAAAIGRANPNFLQALILIVLFIIIATSGIATPVYVAFSRKERAQEIFAGWVRWLSANNALIVSLLCLLIGVKLFGDGLGGLL